MSSEKKRFRLSGLNCAVCASRVEDTLKGLPGVEDASVNFAASIAVVQYDPELVDTRQMVEAVKAQGYGAESEDAASTDSASAVIGIGGMTCVNCAARIEKALSQTPGVTDAAVNFAASQAIVHFNPSEVQPETLEKVVLDAGYSVNSIDIQGPGAVGSFSEHPLAQAVTSKAGEAGVEFPPVSGFKSSPGKGVTARSGAEAVAVRTRVLLQESGIDTSVFEDKAEKLSSQGKTVIWVAVNGRAAGLIALADSIRKEAPQAVARLKSMGISVMMLTGDSQATPEAVAETRNTDFLHAFY